MNTQLIGLILLGIIVASNFIDFKSLVEKNNSNKEDPQDSKAENLQPVIKPDFPVELACNDSVFCAVKKWEELKKYCDASGLKVASTKLDEIFPLLVIKEEKNV